THTARCRELLASSGLPVIETWDTPLDPLGHVVGFSNGDTSAAMVAHLADSGYRQLGFIGGDAERDPRGAARRRGFEEAVRAHALPEPALVNAGAPPITVREGANAFRRLYERWPHVEAVLCVSDLSAFGALSEAQRMGLRVPDDLAVAGFGAFDIGDVCNPRLTTTDVGALEIGRRAGALALSAIRGEAREAAHINVPFHILHRESTLQRGGPSASRPAGDAAR
ncbi:MAG: substrate-binding domain-containing protein, partial [Pseudomonadota bacterium]